VNEHSVKIDYNHTVTQLQGQARPFLYFGYHSFCVSLYSRSLSSACFSHAVVMRVDANVCASERNKRAHFLRVCAYVHGCVRMSV